MSREDEPFCEGCKWCTPHTIKVIFFTLSFFFALAAFVMMVYGGTTTFIVWRSDAQQTVDFRTILAPFIKCTEAEDNYYYNSYSTGIYNLINGQACAAQAPALYFFIFTACMVIVVQAFAIYAYSKEGMGALYITGLHVAITAALLLVGIYIMATTTNVAVSQCIDCDGHISAADQQIMWVSEQLRWPAQPELFQRLRCWLRWLAGQVLQWHRWHQ